MAKIKWAPAPPMVGWNRLKSLRLERGLTQPELAVAAGLAVGTVCHLECGLEERVADSTKAKLAAFFECDVDDIFPVQMLGDRPRVEVLAELMKQPRRATAAKATKKG